MANHSNGKSPPFLSPHPLCDAMAPSRWQKKRGTSPIWVIRHLWPPKSERTTSWEKYPSIPHTTQHNYWETYIYLRITLILLWFSGWWDNAILLVFSSIDIHIHISPDITCFISWNVKLNKDFFFTFSFIPPSKHPLLMSEFQNTSCLQTVFVSSRSKIPPV